VGEIEKLAHESNHQIILCGDFNDVPSSRIYRRLSETFDDVWAQVGSGNGFTFPVRTPSKRIDYIWLSKGNWCQPLRAWVPHSEASDHLPLVAELKLK
jgi:endonuclease/exonuclease/phosphatase (EEP) superfamily protein YafD